MIKFRLVFLDFSELSLEFFQGISLALELSDLLFDSKLFKLGGELRARLQFLLQHCLNVLSLKDLEDLV